jgi:branched-chain amino acid transport system ATP-binding protein
LAVKQAEIVALIGLNGAGKSTLLKVIAGLLTPTSGKIGFQSRDITNASVHRRAAFGIAYVMQGGAVFPSLTASDHLQLSARVARKNAHPYSSSLKGHVLGEDVISRRDPVGLYSGGQRQALAVTTMLATNPYLLLCDEPSAGLAPGLAKVLIKSLANVSRERGLPVLWVEQRLSEVLPIADRALLLRAGVVAAETVRPTEWLVPEVLTELTLGKMGRLQ